MTHRSARLILISLIVVFCCGPFAPVKAGTDLKDDTSRPVRPGEPGVRPFWNGNGQRFIYAPAFDLPKVNGAVNYRFTVTARDGKEHTFTAPQPWAALSPVWEDVCEGYTTLKVTGLDASAKEIGISGEKAFYRSPGFSGSAGAAPKSYAEVGREGLKAVFDAPHVQHWLKDGKPDRSYARYCYPNKVIGGLVRGMVAYAKVAEKKEDRDAALKIAQACADYLLTLRFPEGSAYANVAPTYALNVDKPAGKDRLTPERVEKRWLMVPSAIDAGLGFLDLYDLTKDPKYLDAAKAIADAFLKTQEADGTWPLMADWKTGKAVAPNRLIPTWVLFYFDRLAEQHALAQYKESRNRAWQWIVENPLKTYQWDAQFEDVVLRGPYQNLAREQACDVARMLLNNPQRTVDEIAQAEELIRFAEDQFVEWAPVQDVAGWRKAMPKRYQNCDIWIVPGVFEQYVCYGPVARSSAILINTYLNAYDVTQKPAYLEKARALVHGMAAGQEWMNENFDTKGEIPTWNMKRKPINWLNNSFYAAEAVLNLAHYASMTQLK